jgi:hypothetical protein
MQRQKIRQIKKQSQRKTQRQKKRQIKKQSQRKMQIQKKRQIQAEPEAEACTELNTRHKKSVKF